MFSKERLDAETAHPPQQNGLRVPRRLPAAAGAVQGGVGTFMDGAGLPPGDLSLHRGPLPESGGPADSTRMSERWDGANPVASLRENAGSLPGILPEGVEDYPGAPGYPRAGDHVVAGPATARRPRSAGHRTSPQIRLLINSEAESPLCQTAPFPELPKV